MIKRKIVFVLGAGASEPYGLPLGWQLSEYLHKANKASALAAVLSRCCDILEAETERFSDSFLKSGRGSIDAFLSNRRDMSRIGKLAIAHELITRERADQVFRTGNLDNWYSKLWDVMMDGASSHHDLSRNTVRFVTFNYDRSLEFFLHEATKHTFNVGDVDAFNAWSKIGILHLYGSLGTLNSGAPQGFREYGPNYTPKSLFDAAEGIKVIPESRDDDKDFQMARHWFSVADEIVYLGFGFDPLNVKRLGLGDVLEQLGKNGKGLPRVWASVFRKTTQEVKIIRDVLCPNSAPFVALDYKNLDSLRNSLIFE
jgi:hypothetical protein